MWVNYNPNPSARNVIDCSIRALCRALNVDWETAFALSAMNAYKMCDMMVSDAVWGSVLREHGYTKHLLPTSCPDCYTVADFGAEHTSGTYVLKTGNHVVTIVDGNWYDTWDSGNEIVIYYWTKETEA